MREVEKAVGELELVVLTVQVGEAQHTARGWEQVKSEKDIEFDTWN